MLIVSNVSYLLLYLCALHHVLALEAIQTILRLHQEGKMFKNRLLRPPRGVVKHHFKCNMLRHVVYILKFIIIFVRAVPMPIILNRLANFTLEQ